MDATDLGSIGAAVGGACGGAPGAVVGGILGRVLAHAPGVDELISGVSGNFSHEGIKWCWGRAARRFSSREAEITHINGDLQSAFRDAVREALYDIGGETCFPDRWKSPRDVPEQVVFTWTKTYKDRAKLDSTLAEQVSAPLVGLDVGLRSGKVLPIEPPVNSPEAIDTYLQATTPQDLADAFFDQAIAPALKSYGQLPPGLHPHLQEHLLPRALIHFPEFVKTRPEAWRAYGGFMLEGLRDELRELAQGKAEVDQALKQLAAAAASPGWSAALGDVVKAVGEAERLVGESLSDLVKRLGTQHREVIGALQGIQAKVEGVALQVTAVGTDVKAMLGQVEEIAKLLRGTPTLTLSIHGSYLVAAAQPVQVMLRERGTRYLERHRLFAGRGEEIGRIEEFLRTRQRGYVFVTGPPGYGKSALLSNCPL